jgi:hypothetical protein
MNLLVQAIHRLKPNAEFTFTEDDYSSIEWINLEGSAPTTTEIEAAIKEIKAEEKSAAVALDVKKQEVLAKLGLTADEAALLLG